VTRADLISDAYLAEQVRLHAAPRGYGARGSRWAEAVHALASQYHCRTILDYGCGQGSLARALTPMGRTVTEYDPAVAGKDQLPTPADLVVCTDVLEHVESAHIFAVAQHLAALTRRALFLVVSLVETDKRLSDGRQAHILLRTPAWWQTLLEAHDFQLARQVPTGAKHWGTVWRRSP
jgi:2-polyprenyl-3-methyl-5-hydroxy-6-metoxy-1,4-benzoquinol methylase